MYKEDLDVARELAKTQKKYGWPNYINVATGKNVKHRILETSKKFSNGKVVSILEGGYDLQALADSSKRHVDALLEFN